MHRRDFMISAMATGALAAAPPAFSLSPALEAKAVRTAKGLRLEWSAGAEPVSIFVSSDPAAPRAYMHELQAGVRGGAADLPLAVTPRPYLLLQTKGGRQTRVAERLLPLQGGRNFRDLGGYRAADGRQVRWGRIYRSGVMNGLTAADQAYLSGLGLAVVCDLRTPEERKAEPSPLVQARWPQVTATDYAMSASLDGLGKARTRAEAIAAFAQSYVDFIEVLTPQYTDMFARLARREAPLAVNCTAGKDRTGVASALILSVLGVPRDAVAADYALTEVYTPPSLYLDQMARAGSMPGLTAEQVQMFRRMPREVLGVLMGSDAEVMRLALARIDQKYGGPVELAKARFGLTDETVGLLRDTYLV